MIDFFNCSQVYAAHPYRRFTVDATDIRLGHVTCLVHLNVSGRDI